MKIPRVPNEFTYADSENECLLKRDIKELRICARDDLYKATMLLAGSIVECALMDFLTRRQGPAENAYVKLCSKRQAIEDWRLSEMLEVARHLRFLRDETYKLCDLVRDYRNLIHPALERRKALEPNTERALRSVQGMVECLGDLNLMASQAKKDIIILNIQGVAHRLVEEPDTIAEAITEMAVGHGHVVKSISSQAELEETLSNPPQDSIIFNLHGELVPTPPRFSGRWREYFVDIAKHVREDGWIWASLAGYPFWAYDNNVEVRDAGLNAFLSTLNATADCMNPSRVDFTEYGRRVLNRFGMKGLPLSMHASRCAAWKGVSPYRIFLQADRKCGATALKIGRGYFLQVGLILAQDMLGIDPRLRARILGNLSFAFAVSI